MPQITPIKSIVSANAADEMALNLIHDAAAHNFRDLLIITAVLLIILCIWAILYLIQGHLFIKSLREKEDKTWQALGCPNLWRQNFVLIKLLFSKDIHHLNINTQQHAKRMRYLSYLGLCLLFCWLACFIAISIMMN